ncbi:MAG: TIGR03619 family F420-dependent LLM class oxidoreductase [Gammaproteobacteria bacterium]
MKLNVGMIETRFPPFGDGRPADPWLFAREAERLGFESLWAGEHHLIPGRSGSSNEFHTSGVPATPDCLVRLAGVAAATRTLKIGTSILLLPQHHPILLAKQLATLDQDCGGRLEIGIGMGWNREECEIMGGHFDRRAAQTRESVEAMKKLWTHEFVEHHGEFYDFPPVKSSPGPLTRLHPPILLGMHSERALARVVAYGDGWLESVTRPEALRGEGVEHIARGREKLDALCREAGRDPASVPISVILTDVRGDVDADLVRRYHQAGAVRVVLLGEKSEPGDFASERAALDWLARRAGRVLGHA